MAKQHFSIRRKPACRLGATTIKGNWILTAVRRDVTCGSCKATKVYKTSAE